MRKSLLVTRSNEFFPGYLVPLAIILNFIKIKKSIVGKRKEKMLSMFIAVGNVTFSESNLAAIIKCF